MDELTIMMLLKRYPWAAVRSLKCSKKDPWQALCRQRVRKASLMCCEGSYDSCFTVLIAIP